MDAAEFDAVAKSMRAAWLGTGPKVAAFEELIAEYKGVKHAVAVNSSTAGLHLSYLPVGLQPGDEVIVPAIMFCATGKAIIYAGARALELLSNLMRRLKGQSLLVFESHFSANPIPN